MAVRQFMGYAKWWILSKCGRKSPLVITMGIGYACNLRCRHCHIDSMLKANPGMKAAQTYEEIVSDLESRYMSGARIAYFEGGETTVWKDGDRDLGDLIDAAKRIGYYNVGYTTNGTTGRIFTNSDTTTCAGTESTTRSWTPSPAWSSQAASTRTWSFRRATWTAYARRRRS